MSNLYILGDFAGLNRITLTKSKDGYLLHRNGSSLNLTLEEIRQLYDSTIDKIDDWFNSTELDLNLDEKEILTIKSLTTIKTEEEIAI